LFENVIRDLAKTVTEMRHNAETWKEKHDQVCDAPLFFRFSFLSQFHKLYLLQANRDMDILIWKQSRDLESAVNQSKTHKSEDSAVYRDLQDELYQREKDMNMMESTLSDLSIWFPNFDQYGTSVLR
jgi:hypothetical protein